MLYKAVEVGVDRGQFAAAFLSKWLGEEYFGVDCYETYDEMGWDRQFDYQLAVHALQPHSSRFRLIKKPSIEAAGMFAPGSIDFVYIDGAHNHSAVCGDLLSWWDVVSDKGILAGHDFDESHPGVIRAVTEFGKRVKQDVFITKVEGFLPEQCPSWYIYKSGIPGPDWRRC